MAEEQPTWLTVGQVAKELQVGDETVRRWIRSGELKVLNLGGRTRPDYRIRRQDLDEFIAGRYGAGVKDKAA